MKALGAAEETERVNIDVNIYAFPQRDSFILHSLLAVRFFIRGKFFFSKSNSFILFSFYKLYKKFKFTFRVSPSSIKYFHS